MAFPQGIAFRLTLAYVENVSPDNGEAYSPPIGENPFNDNYPRTTTENNVVGWEAIQSGILTARNRNTANVRLAGMNYAETVGQYAVYRIDLPSPGTYSIKLAMGDYDNATGPMTAEVFDNAASLGKLIDAQSTVAATNWFDASGVERTSAADWESNNVAVEKTFSSTICRFRFTGPVAYLYIEAAAGGGATLMNVERGRAAVRGILRGV